VRERILICGNPDDESVGLVVTRALELGVPHLVVSQRQFADTPFGFEIAQRRIVGTFVVDGRAHRAEECAGVYLRMGDDHRLPELAKEPAGSALRVRARLWRDTINRWADIAPSRVINRPSAVSSHCSRPLQSQIIQRHGFRVPETLMTSEPELALDFFNQHPIVLRTSASGARPMSKPVTPDDLARLERIRWCPGHFQEQIKGRHVRVHVVGNQVFATGITDDGADTWPREGKAGSLYALKPSDDLAAQSITLAMELDLPFVALDLRITPDDVVYCLDANPNPAFSDCETRASQPISAALVRYLAEERDL
jgi:hypothetical protein